MHVKWQHSYLLLHSWTTARHALKWKQMCKEKTYSMLVWYYCSYYLKIIMAYRFNYLNISVWHLTFVFSTAASLIVKVIWIDSMGLPSTLYCNHVICTYRIFGIIYILSHWRSVLSIVSWLRICSSIYNQNKCVVAQTRYTDIIINWIIYITHTQISGVDIS